MGWGLYALASVFVCIFKRIISIMHYAERERERSSSGRLSRCSLGLLLLHKAGTEAGDRLHPDPERKDTAGGVYTYMAVFLLEFH